MSDIYTRLLLLVMVVSLVSGCQENGADIGSGAADGPSSLVFTMMTDRPMDFEEAIAGHDLATIYFVGTMGCSNHDPMHIATTFEKMKELSGEPTNCRGWKFVGAITESYDAYLELLNRRAAWNESLLQREGP